MVVGRIKDVAVGDQGYIKIELIGYTGEFNLHYKFFCPMNSGSIATSLDGHAVHDPARLGNDLMDYIQVTVFTHLSRWVFLCSPLLSIFVFPLISGSFQIPAA